MHALLNDVVMFQCVSEISLNDDGDGGDQQQLCNILQRLYSLNCNYMFIVVN